MVRTGLALSTELWRKVSKSVSWAYRLNHSRCNALCFITGRNNDLLPPKSIWEIVRKEVNRQRRNRRTQQRLRDHTDRKIARREYMRVYMATRRSECR
jgi:hypothetical protein